MTEQWKPISGCSDYMVSDQGRICRLRKTPPKSRNGYHTVRIKKDDGTLTTISVHRTVLETFKCPCPPGLESRHLDGDKGNNCLDNLEWGTWEENHADAILHGKRMDKLTKSDADEIRQSSDSIHAIARKYGVCRKHVREIRSGKHFL